MEVIKCSFCGFEFNEEKAQKGCKACPMGASCGKIKCPRCNFEMVKEPQFLKTRQIVDWGKKVWKTTRTLIKK